ncbi:hypothetical protein chiPu_0008287 [Chiloscyllium punctatum]|uniref:Uncharacterized protein n=1 Tax=Chiloscyllium punctatum TaxID=137246 RepID=A0A401SHM2_CHIPU|nr:hypothetical protein [Chiloscyllium punctatum]
MSNRPRAERAVQNGVPCAVGEYKQRIGTAKELRPGDNINLTLTKLLNKETDRASKRDVEVRARSRAIRSQEVLNTLFKLQQTTTLMLTRRSNMIGTESSNPTTNGVG